MLKSLRKKISLISCHSACVRVERADDNSMELSSMCFSVPSFQASYQDFFAHARINITNLCTLH